MSVDDLLLNHQGKICPNVFQCVPLSSKMRPLDAMPLGVLHQSFRGIVFRIDRDRNELNICRLFVGQFVLHAAQQLRDDGTDVRAPSEDEGYHHHGFVLPLKFIGQTVLCGEGKILNRSPHQLASVVGRNRHQQQTCKNKGQNGFEQAH